MKFGGAMAFYSNDLPASGPVELGRVGVWRDVALQRWRTAFERLGQPLIEVAHPEAYPSAAYLPGGAQAIAQAPQSMATEEGAPPVHLSFRRLETLNYIKGARNVCVWPWRYSSLSNQFVEGAGIRANAVHMLGLADQIWCPNETTAEVLRSHGLAAVAAPAPVDAAPPPRNALRAAQAYRVDFDSHARRRPEKRDLNEFLGVGGGQSLLFLTVADPDDGFNNLEATLRGFALAARTARAQGGPVLKMVVVLALDPRRRAETLAVDWLSRIVNQRFQLDADLVSEDMLFIADPLPPGAFNALCERADFYLSALAATDQNLPLQTAMAFAAVPVALIAGEAAEYLTEETAFAIPGLTETLPLKAPFADAAPEWLGRETAQAERLTALAVADACLEAAAASAERRAQVAAAAAQLAAERFAPEAVERRLLTLLAGLADVAPRRIRANRGASAGEGQAAAFERPSKAETPRLVMAGTPA